MYIKQYLALENIFFFGENLGIALRDCLKHKLPIKAL